MSKLLPDPERFQDWKDWAHAFTTAVEERERELLNAQYSPDIHFVGATGEPPFAGVWFNVGVGNIDLHFFKDHSGIVHVIGIPFTTSAATLQTIFTLPVGFRPIANLVGSGVAGNVFARVDILSSGIVRYNIGGNPQGGLGINQRFSVYGR